MRVAMVVAGAVLSVLVRVAGGVEVTSALPKLVAGDAAPVFRVERFVKGEGFAGLEKGKVYVIEFWASWCGPCVQSIPNLSRLQAQYKAKDVVICGVDVEEEPTLTAATLAKVDAFVERRGDGMSYEVAYDGAEKYMEQEWLKRTAAPGIPWAVVVGRDGKIAWMGHSMEVGPVLEEVAENRWDIVEGPKRIAAAETELKAALGAYGKSVAEGDAAWATAAAAHPDMAQARVANHFAAMLAAKDEAGAFSLGREIIAASKQSKDPTEMQDMMVVLRAQKGRRDEAWKSLLMDAAEATFALSDAMESGPHLVLAEACFLTGDDARGRRECAAAIERSDPVARDATVKYVQGLEAGAVR